MNQSNTMAEYIDRKRAIVEACNSLELYPSEYAKLEDALNTIPAADVAEVIRCKDCIYYKNDTEYCKKHDKGYCCLDDDIKPKNHYCGYAERKENSNA